ncbi:hypothetical protein GmHk_06G015021 [Glycine max]|nr:hypothetical protein GmHk_06G015021 [Glycine max]
MKMCGVGKRLENVEDGVCEGGITECCYDYEDRGVYGVYAGMNQGSTLYLNHLPKKNQTL